MIDRQDIDALLIGALYGELTPADEARLQAHLESHPADKSALADLTSARAAVRESRFLTVQLEPPQAVSALLLQEASRRAKPVANPAKDDRSESWFARFVRSFAAHPAMAAAAMLVLVIGVAGTMYVRGSAQTAERTTQSLRSEEIPAPAASAGARGNIDDALELQRNAGSAFQAQLAEPDGAPAAGETATGAVGAGAAIADRKERKAAEIVKAESTKDAKKTPARTYLQPEGKPSPKPMDLEQGQKGGASKPDTVSRNESDDAFRMTRKPGTGSTRPTPPGVVVVPRNDPATVPSPMPASPRTVDGRGPAGGDSQVQRDGKEKAKLDEEATWARAQHGRVAAAVRANNCKEATQLAMALFNRAPAYYNANVENDRALKQCVTYITAEREREVERTQRARSIQRRNMDESRRPAADKPAPSTNNK